MVQNLEGGVIKKILVKEGQRVKQNQQLLLIDNTRFLSDFREQDQQVANLTASVLQLSVSINSITINNDFNENNWKKNVVINHHVLIFPAELETNRPELVQRQRAAYRENINSLLNQLSVIDQKVNQKQQEFIGIQSKVNNLRQSYRFAQEELKITKPLADEGIVPKIELLKLQRQVNDTRRDMISNELNIPAIQSSIREIMLSRIGVALNFRLQQQKKLNSTQDELSSLIESSIGLEDRVNRTVVLSPVTGIIKKLNINTVGGVIQPGMELIEIVPTEDILLVETKVAPRDIAFLHPQLHAIVKFTAYDFTKYGGLTGKIEHISADTTQDKDGNSFYLVRIRTDKTHFGQEMNLPIIPGMTTSVDIITGKRTILDYLIQPILRAQKNSLKE